MPDHVTKKHVQQRVSDWICRLNALYDQLDEWCAAIPDVMVKRESLKQVIENLMKEHNVGPRDVPTYTIFFQKKKRIAFVPSALWIIGANGRVNVTTNVRQHILVDLGGREGQSSNWQLVDPKDRRMLRPFDHHAFLGLLEE